MADTPPQSVSALLKAIDFALELATTNGLQSRHRQAAAPLPGLVKRAEAILASDDWTPVLRTIHHFACTGGTIISRLISAMPNTVLLSEIDPLSTMKVRHDRPDFAPTDVIGGLRHAFRKVDETTLIDTFTAALETLAARLRREGRVLVLRDHAHSQFCVQRDPLSRPTLNSILEQRFRTLSVVSVRHPLDSFASLCLCGWNQHFHPNTLDDYSRRYLMFLDVHARLPVVKFEDFTEDPDATSQMMCRQLDLPWSKTAKNVLSIVNMSGNSGRSSDVIQPRARGEIDNAIIKQTESAKNYHMLCERLDYRP